jgi:hypothetical protein
MKYLILFVGIFLIQLQVDARICVACLGSHTDAKGRIRLAHYGIKNCDRPDSYSCKGLWDTHSYRIGTIASCSVPRSYTGIVDFYGKANCPVDKKVSECCQERYSLVAQKM